MKRCAKVLIIPNFGIEYGSRLTAAVMSVLVTHIHVTFSVAKLLNSFMLD